MFAVDRLVLTLINCNGVQPGDFVTEKDGEEEEGTSVRMMPKARHRVIAAWERLLESRIAWPPDESPKSIRDVIRHQVRAFGGWLVENRPYTPFLWKV